MWRATHRVGHLPRQRPHGARRGADALRRRQGIGLSAASAARPASKPSPSCAGSRCRPRRGTTPSDGLALVAFATGARGGRGYDAAAPDSPPGDTSMSSTLTNHQVRLARRPEGMATRDNWQLHHRAGGRTGRGRRSRQDAVALARPRHARLDERGQELHPAGRASATSCAPAAWDASSPRATRTSRSATSCTARSACRSTRWSPQEEIKRTGLTKIDLERRLDHAMAQRARHAGHDRRTSACWTSASRKPGDTVVVSGAAGAVGQTVGQLAKIKGCRAVGIAGGQAKCDWVVERARLRRLHRLQGGRRGAKALKTHCPKGVDIYFDNVGGEILDAALASSRAAPASSSAAPSASTTTRRRCKGPKNYLTLLVNRARMQGMVVFDYADRYHRRGGRDVGLSARRAA